jgi:hypothetical protein
MYGFQSDDRTAFDMPVKIRKRAESQKQTKARAEKGGEGARWSRIMERVYI